MQWYHRIILNWEIKSKRSIIQSLIFGDWHLTPSYQEMATHINLLILICSVDDLQNCQLEQSKYFQRFSIFLWCKTQRLLVACYGIENPHYTTLWVVFFSECGWMLSKPQNNQARQFCCCNLPHCSRQNNGCSHTYQSFYQKRDCSDVRPFLFAAMMTVWTNGAWLGLK